MITKTAKEIDHVLVNRRWNVIKNCRVYRKLEFNTDHIHIHHFKTASYDNLLAYVTLSVQSGINTPELQRHLLQRCNIAAHCG